MPSGSKVSPRKSSGVVVPNQATVPQRIGAWIIYVALRLLTGTLRSRLTDQSGVTGPNPLKPAIFCVWHNRLALSMHIYFDFVQRSNSERRLSAMVSASKDGAFLARILENFGVQPVRGSSSRRGPQALLELTSWAQLGYDIAITPDGPRGPCYRVQPGVMALAQLTGLPVVPVTAFLKWKIRLKSWDRFQIPVPFSRCDLFFGEPLEVPREASDSEREALRVEVEKRLLALTRD